MDTAVSVELFVEILNRYVYYFDQQNETVSRLLVHVPLRDINLTDAVHVGNDKVPQWAD